MMLLFAGYPKIAIWIVLLLGAVLAVGAFVLLLVAIMIRWDNGWAFISPRPESWLYRFIV